MSYVPGYKIVLQFDNKVLCGYRNHSMDAEADMAESTSGESTNQWKTHVPMYKGMTFSVDGLYDPDTTKEGVQDVLDLLKAGTKFTAVYGGEEIGDEIETVDAYITHVGKEGAYDDLASYTVDAIASGEPVSSTVLA